MVLEKKPPLPCNFKGIEDFPEESLARLSV